MIWLTWRQFRTQAMVALGVLAGVAVLFCLTGQNLHQIFDSSGIATCRSADACSAAQSAFLDRVKGDSLYPVLYFAGIGGSYLALAAMGMFWGAPLIARELEAGTFRLTWNQSTTRTRWLAVKLGVITLTGMAAAGLCSWLITWWSGPIDRADAMPGYNTQAIPNRFNPLIFGARDVLPVGCAAFALVLGITIGLLVRRTLPAMAVTFAVFVAALVVLPVTVWPHIATPQHTVTELRTSGGPGTHYDQEGSRMSVSMEVNIPGAWVLSTQTVDPAGRPFTGPVTPACAATNATPQACFASIDRLNLRQVVTYQPASRYWRFQWSETAAYLVLAGIMTAFCIRRIRLSEARPAQ
ncbi:MULTISPECIES: ABC transporter permease [Streptacidiphilus]|uniref:ABC transporter permease n=1 Tax=Streptacidiphilus cavernicola TaxID=3342716 RepID=A0ABV6UQ50_9ACTN|nr:ABC transporter permease [Streptacidiphilus jeojiense]